MISEQTAHTVASLLVVNHRLAAPRIAADIVEALDGDSELQRDWLKITRRVWRTLHQRMH